MGNNVFPVSVFAENDNTGILVVDKQEDGGYITINDVQGESSVFVSRIRQDITVENGISLWVSGDAYKIAAQNILALLKQFLKK